MPHAVAILTTRPGACLDLNCEERDQVPTWEYTEWPAKYPNFYDASNASNASDDTWQAITRVEFDYSVLFDDGTRQVIDIRNLTWVGGRPGPHTQQRQIAVYDPAVWDTWLPISSGLEQWDAIVAQTPTTAQWQAGIDSVTQQYLSRWQADRTGFWHDVIPLAAAFAVIVFTGQAEVAAGPATTTGTVVADPAGVAAASSVTADQAQAAIVAEMTTSAGGAAATAGAIDAASVGGASAAAAGATVAANAASSTASTAATASAASAAATAGDTLASISSTVTGFVTDIQNTLSSVLGPIGDAIHTISQTIQTINDGIIKPILDPIVSITQSVNTLEQEIHRDLQDGIQGLLRIPDDLSRALSSVDSTVQRSLSMLGASNADNIKNVLVPGLHESVGAPVSKAVNDVGAALRGRTVEPGDEAAVTLTEPAALKTIREDYRKITDQFINAKGFFGDLLHFIGITLETAPSLYGMLSAFIEQGRDAGRAALETTQLAPAQALTALLRGIINRESFNDEMKSAGYSDARIETIFRLGRTLLGATDLVDHWHRGLLSDTQIDQGLAELGYSADDIGRILRASEDLPTLADVIYNVDRQVAITKFGAPATLSTPPPDAVLEIARARGISTSAATVAWQNHWVLLSAADGVQAWFRGYISRSQLEAILQFNALAPEQWQNYIDLQRPEIPTVSIPALIAQGIITENDALDVLRRRGMTDLEANWLIGKSSKGKNTPTPAAADALHGLTVSTVTGLYDAGTLDREAALSLLVSLGMGTQAADLALNLRDLQAQAAERKAQTDLVLATHDAGGYTFEEAQAQLAALGLTPLEVAKATTALEKSLLVKNKLPSQADLLAMYQYGMLTRAEAAQALTLIGYSMGWAELILQVEDAKHAPRTAG